MRNKISLLFAFLFFFLLTAFSIEIPFFWDGTFFSELSVYFFENGFCDFIAPPQVDTGGFPLYSLFMAIVWKFFGKTLIVSHLAITPFLIGITYEYFKLAKRFLKPGVLPFAMLLLLAEPTFITQSMLMGYDILMVYFFFLALNALLNKKHLLFTFALTLLCISSMRGMVLGFSLLMIDMIINYTLEKKNKIIFVNYILPATVVFIWAIYHQHRTGWFFFSPEREHTHEAFVSFKMMFRQFIYILWKIVDFGRISLWLFFVFAAIYYYKKQNGYELKILLVILFVPLFVLVLFMVPLSNPIGHKYFIATFLCLNIAVCFFLQQLKTKIVQVGLVLFLLLMLITGNFWMYDQRFGNGWDSSLKIIPYFELKNQMDHFITENNIPQREVGTQFPMITDMQYSHLENTSFRYSDVWKVPFSNFKYALLSNVINTDRPGEFEKIKKKWILLKELKSGRINLSLYQNPDL